MFEIVLHTGDKVTHSTLGEGVVTFVDAEYVTVKFATVERTFRLPDAFYKGFLTSRGVVFHYDKCESLLKEIQRAAIDIKAAKSAFDQFLEEENKEYVALPDEQKDGVDVMEYIEAIENAISGLEEVIEDLGEAIEQMHGAVEEKDSLMQTKLL